MKGIQIKEYVEGPNDLKVIDLPTPTPKPNEYLIAIHATAANFFDILQIRGKYQTQPPFPWVAGMEFSGVVLKAPTALPGGKTPAFKEGDKVFGGNQGAYATHITCTEEMLKPLPEGWSYEDAAGMFVTGPTSYGGLVVRAGVKEGDWVLVHAAAGGVGLAAVQIAKAFGATVIATAGTAHKLDVARSFGADYAVNYRDADWPEQVKKLTPKGRGVDIVYDPVGLIDKSMKCIAWNGRLLVIGFAGGPIEKIATNRILLKNISVVGLFWGALIEKQPEIETQVWDGIFKLVKEGKYRGTTFTDKEYVGLESVPAALNVLGGRDSWGKVIVKVPQDGAICYNRFPCLLQSFPKSATQAARLRPTRKDFAIIASQDTTHQPIAESICTCDLESSSPITQEPLAWSLTPSTIQDQNTCPFCTPIPREIRDMIFSYALTDTTSYPVDQYRNPCLYSSDMALSLLLTCKAIYLETHITPLCVNPFVITALRSQMSSALKVWQLAEIRGLDITLEQWALDCGHLFKKLKSWAAKSRKKGAYMVPEVYKEKYTWGRYCSYATSFNSVLIPVNGVPDKKPRRLCEILTNVQTAPFFPTLQCFVNKRCSVFQPLTHLTLRIHHGDWWMDQPYKNDDPKHRLYMDPTFGVIRAGCETSDLMMFRAAERRIGRQLDQATESPFGHCWGPQIGKVLPDLKSWELVLEMFKMKADLLHNVVECAKTWRFAMGALDGEQVAERNRQMLVWDGEVIVKEWKKKNGMVDLSLPKDAADGYIEFEVQVVRYVKKTVD
ncbi:Qor NADPH:quinone reductase [Pyrenophora tritici-repentis]|nr:Qor NADPH:quinone reductase [Pyrenophora tritici-repentis]KAI1551788.1 Qor NADPH:quinone reductase [Pyrenophora tritici-repentis]